MSKYLRIMLLFVWVIATMVIFVACSNVVSIQKIEMKDSGTIDIVAGEFDYEGKYVVVTYSSGNKAERELTADMIPASEKIKFYREGEQEVKVVYANHSTILKINVSRHTFDDIYTIEDKTVTYDGQNHKIEIEEELPEGVEVTYPYGNTFRDVGVYQIIVILTREGYETKELTATLTINKATIDMSNVSFESETVDYDGETKNIYAKNVPDGVTVEYKKYRVANQMTLINNPRDAGEYRVIATFTADPQNYNPIPSREATLTISRANYNTSQIVFNDVVKTYDGSEYEATLGEGSVVPQGVICSYKYYDEVGENQVTGHANVGTYTMEVSFAVSNPNYNSINPIRAKLYVRPQVITISDYIELMPTQPVYDGEVHSLSFTITKHSDDPASPIQSYILLDANGTETNQIDEVATIDFTLRNNTGLANISATADFGDTNHKVYAGYYQVTALFTLDNSNYVLDLEESKISEYLYISVLDATMNFDEDNISIDNTDHNVTLKNIDNSLELVNIGLSTHNETSDTEFNPNKIYYERNENYVSTLDSTFRPGVTYYEYKPQPTEDTMFMPNKTYYVLSADLYIPTLDTAFEVGKTYYEISYRITEDTTFDPNKVYFETNVQNQLVETTDNEMIPNKDYYEQVIKETQDLEMLDYITYLERAYVIATESEMNPGTMYYEYHYVATSDTSMNSAKDYYEKSRTYVVSEDTEFNSIKTYYEILTDTFAKTTDIEVDSTKTYYVEIDVFNPSYDTSFVAGKVYYERDDLYNYFLTKDESFNVQKDYFEVTILYVVTSDTEFDANKAYYEYSKNIYTWESEQVISFTAQFETKNKDARDSVTYAPQSGNYVYIA